MVKCPKCAVTFPVPGTDQFTSAPPPPSAAAQFSPALPPPGPAFDPGFTGGAPAMGQSGLSNAYNLDLGRMFSVAGQHYGAVLGPMIGFLAILLVALVPLYICLGLLGIVPILGTVIVGVLQATFVPHLGAGLLIVSLAQLRGQPWTFGHFFHGFNYWVPLFVVNLLVNLLSFVCLLPAELLNLAAGVNQIQQIQQIMEGADPARLQPVDPLLSLGASLLSLIGLAIFLTIHVRYFTLCNYLIVDRGCGAMEAIHGQRALNEGHFFGWLGVVLLFGLIGGVGVLGCCVGLLFSVPYSLLLTTSAYLQATSPGQEPGQ